MDTERFIRSFMNCNTLDNIVYKRKKDAGPEAPHLFVYVPALYLASRPARMALMLVSTTASPLRPKMALMAFSSSSKAISR